MTDDKLEIEQTVTDLQNSAAEIQESLLGIMNWFVPRSGNKTKEERLLEHKKAVELFLEYASTLGLPSDHVVVEDCCAHILEDYKEPPLALTTAKTRAADYAERKAANDLSNELNIEEARSHQAYRKSIVETEEQKVSCLHSFNELFRQEIEVRKRQATAAEKQATALESIARALQTPGALPFR